MADEYSSADIYAIDSLISIVAQSLRKHPQGLGEYELIKIVKHHGYFEFMDPPPADLHELFRAHFLLFHALYRLRDQLRAAQAADLEINTLNIRYRRYHPGRAALSTPDPLREYYLDLSHMETTTVHDVQQLISSFWTRLQRHDQRAEALKELGLADPVDNDTIIKTYRRMAMRHHPDRGGSEKRQQALNKAVGILSKKG
jgi:DnaJ-domain-containing protein 1